MTKFLRSILFGVVFAGVTTPTFAFDMFPNIPEDKIQAYDDREARFSEFMETKNMLTFLGDQDVEFAFSEDLNTAVQTILQNPGKYLKTDFTPNSEFLKSLTRTGYRDQANDQASLTVGTFRLFQYLLDKGSITKEIILKTQTKEDTILDYQYQDSFLRTVIDRDRVDILQVLFNRNLVSQEEVVHAFNQIRYLSGAQSISSVLNLINNQFHLSLQKPPVMMICPF